MPLAFAGMGIQAKGTDYQIPYELRLGANKINIKAQKGLFKRDIVAERRQLAEDFYRKFDPKISKANLESYVKGTDLNLPVKVIKISANTELFQYTKYTTEGTVARGEYYTNNPYNTPTDLGISDKYSVRDPNNGWKKTDEVKVVEQQKVTIENPSEALKSTSSPAIDDWSLKDAKVPTKGHGSQIYIPKNQ